MSILKILFVKILFALLLLPSAAQCQNELSLRLFQQQDRYDCQPIAGNCQVDSAHEQLRAGVGYRGFYVSSMLDAQQSSGGHNNDHRLILQEAYWQHDIHAFTVELGKKVMSWGVGYGFRPLDVIQNEQRQALGQWELEGVPQASVTWFGETASLSAIAIHRPRFDGLHPHKGQSEGTLRYADLWGETDVYALLHSIAGQQHSAGLAASSVIGEHMEWHGSMRYARNFMQANALQTLAGTSWTWQGGWTLLAEVWRDTSSLSRLQNNLMTRVSYDGDKLDLYMHWLHIPRDASNQLQGNIEYRIANSSKLFMQSRWQGGQQQSLLRRAGQTFTILIGLQLDMDAYIY